MVFFGGVWGGRCFQGIVYHLGMGQEGPWKNSTPADLHSGKAHSCSASFFYISQEFLRNDVTHSGLALLNRWINKTIPHSNAHRPTWSGQLPSWGFYLGCVKVTRRLIRTNVIRPFPSSYQFLMHANLLWRYISLKSSFGRSPYRNISSINTFNIYLQIMVLLFSKCFMNIFKK